MWPVGEEGKTKWVCPLLGVKTESFRESSGWAEPQLEAEKVLVRDLRGTWLKREGERGSEGWLTCSEGCVAGG